MTELALPRARVKRRKIKPPHRFWYLAVFCFLIAMGFGVSQLIDVIQGERPVMNAAWFFMNMCWVASWWPSVKSPFEPVLPDQRPVKVGWGCFFFGFIAWVVL